MKRKPVASAMNLKSKIFVTRNAVILFIFIHTIYNGLLQYNLYHQNVSVNDNIDSLVDLAVVDSGSGIDDGTTAKHSIERYSNNRKTTARQQFSEERLGFVDYFACCGAGHRMTKLSNAYYVSRVMNFSLRISFGLCNNQDVFSLLFGHAIIVKESNLTVPIVSNQKKTSVPGMQITIKNESPWFKKLKRMGNSRSTTTTCPCSKKQFLTDQDLYITLRDRFRSRKRIETFMLTNSFSAHTVIGLHVRAGNNETGSFSRKNRTIHDSSTWCNNMANLILNISNEFIDPPLLFIATDTLSIFSNIRSILGGRMVVLSLPQHRLDSGTGVMFGEVGKVLSSGENCLNGWLDSFSDMFLLSYADVVIAGRPSSFTQGLPMTMVLSKSEARRKVTNSYCETNTDATKLRCYSGLEDWCCKGATSFSLSNQNQPYEYLRVPKLNDTGLVDEYRKIAINEPIAYQKCTSSKSNGPIISRCARYLGNSAPQRRSRKKNDIRKRRKKLRNQKTINVFNNNSQSKNL